MSLREYPENNSDMMGMKDRPRGPVERKMSDLQTIIDDLNNSFGQLAGKIDPILSPDRGSSTTIDEPDVAEQSQYAHTIDNYILALEGLNRRIHTIISRVEV